MHSTILSGNLGSASHAQSVVPPPRTYWQPLDDVDDVDDIISRMAWHSLRHRDAEALDFTPPTADECESRKKTNEREKEKENWDPPLG